MLFRSVAFIRDRHEPGLAAWIVETLAGSLAVPIVVLPGAPVNRARDLAGLMVIALAEAARARPDSRRDIVQQTIVPHVEELLTLASEWRGQHNRLDWTGRPWASPARQ